MAFNSSALLPYLYDVQKNIEHMEKYYGSRVLAKVIEKPESAGSSTDAMAPKNRIMNFLIRCGDSLFQYSVVRKSLTTMYESRKNTALMYLVFIVLFLTLMMAGVLFMVGYSVYKIWKDVKDAAAGTLKAGDDFFNRAVREQGRTTWYTIIGLLLYAFIISVTVKMYNRNKAVYAKTLNGNILEEGRDGLIIRDVVNMFNVIEFNDQMPTEVVTNNPLLHWYYMQVKKTSLPLDNVDGSDGGDGGDGGGMGGLGTACGLHFARFLTNQASSGGGGSGDCIDFKPPDDSKDDDLEANPEQKSCCDLTSEVELVKNCYLCDSVFNGEKYIPPFHPNMADTMWTYTLLRKLQNKDIPLQVGRIRSAMDYIKALVLKDVNESENGKSLDAAAEKALIKTIADTIAPDVAEVLDLSIVDVSQHGTALDSTVTTAAACYAKALSEPSVMAAYFDKTTSKGYTLTKEQLSKTWLRYDSGSYASGVLLKGVVNPSGSTVVGAAATGAAATGSYVTIIANKRSINYHDTYFRRECSNPTRDGCTWAYTGTVPSQNIIPGSIKSGIDNWAPDYAELFRDATSSAPANIGTGTNNNMYAVNISVPELIKMKREMRMASVLDSLKETLPGVVIKIITATTGMSSATASTASTASTTGTATPASSGGNDWVLGEKQIDDVLQVVQKTRSDMRKLWNVYRPILHDILLSASTGLVAERNAAAGASKNGFVDGGTLTAAAAENAKFVSLERFQARIAAMDKKEFMNEFMFNLDELRGTSEGLASMYRTFDYSVDVHQTNQSVLDMVVMFTVVIGVMLMIDFGYQNYKQTKEILDPGTYEGALFLDEFNKRFYGRDADRSEAIEAAKSGLWWDFGVKMAMFVAAIVVAVTMVHAFRRKSSDLYDYNRGILQKNTTTIVGGAKTVFETFLMNIMGDQSAVTKISDDDVLVYKRMTMAKGSSVDPKAVAAKISPYEYEVLLDVAKSFDKCSTIFSTSETMVPFPMLEVSIYTVMLVFLVIIFVAVTLTMQPVDRTRSMRRYVRVKARLVAHKEVDGDELPPPCENEAEKRKINNMVKIVVMVMLIVLPIMFAVTLGENIAAFSSTIYLSDYFAKSDCYN